MAEPRDQFPLRLRRAAGLLLLACLTLARARAQADRFQEEYPVVPFRILEQGGEAGVRFDYLSERESSGGASARYSNRTFQEYVEYWMHGYAYHPRFLDFRARFETGLLQQVIERAGVEDDSRRWSENAWLYGYDVNLNFFKDHPASLQLFASRDREPVLELFTDLELIETERHGAVATYKPGPFPMDLYYAETRTREFGAESFSESANRTFEYTVRHLLRDRMYSELRYRHNEFEQDFRADTGFFDVRRRTRLSSDELQFLNTIYLNPARTSWLGTTLRMFKEDGTQEFENFFWQERLHLRHTPNFSTYYLASLLQNKFREATVDTVRGEAGLEHRLFRSLQSHFDVHGRHTDYDGLTEDVRGVTGRLAYQKHTPWGQLSAGYGRTLDQVDRSGGGSTPRIFDEALVLSAFRFVFLSQPEADATSLFVTDAAGQVIYDEGFDYEVRRFGSRLGLRVLSGRLREGDTVLVDYELPRRGDQSYLADLQSFNLGYDFERYLRGLSVYYRWEDQTARGGDGEDGRALLDFNEQTVGMLYRFLCFTWIEEYQQYRSPFSAYDQLRSELEAYHRIGERLRLGWHVGYATTDYQDDSAVDQASSLYANVSLDGTLNRHLLWHTEAGLRREAGWSDETLLGISGKLTYRLRQVKVETGARLEQRDRFDDERQRALFFLQVSREFGRNARAW